MEKIKSRKQLPSWFNLENYKNLERLNDDGLIRQFDLRKILFNNTQKIIDPSSNNPTSEGLYPPVFSNYTYLCISQGYSELLRGAAIWEIPEEWEDHGQTRLFDLPELTSFEKATKQKSAIKFERYRDILDDINELYSNGWTEEQLRSESTARTILNKTRVCDESTHNLHLSIDAWNYSDAEIIQELEKILVSWRRSLGVGRKEKAKAKSSDLIKVLERRYIPLADLLIWGAVSNVKITQALLVDTLFVDIDEAVGETKFTQTHLPHFKKMMSPNYLL